jgi:MFS transporter, FSR family, fosmidomycin resistance protein
MNDVDGGPVSAINYAHKAMSGDRTDYPRVGLLSAGHLMNDLYGNFITSLMPYLVIRGEISTTAAGLVLLVYLIGSSVLQPIFGLVADRTGRRAFAVVGPVWVGIAAAVIGRASTTVTLLAIAAIGGLGTAAFHPQAASMVDSLSPTNKGRSMAYFSMGGNIGFALGPVAAAVVATIGLQWSPLMLLPGAIIGLALARYAPHAGRSKESFTLSDLRATVVTVWKQINLVVSVIAIRSASQYALIIFLPLYYHLRGYSAELGSYYAFILSLAGAIGGLVGGHLSDLYGRRRTVVISLLMAAPLLVVTLLVPPALVWPLIALSGAALLASNSVTVVQGQELLPRHRGLASGLTLGLGFGLSGIIASGLTALADHIGVGATIFAAPALAVLAAILASFVRNTSGSKAASSGPSPAAKPGA